MPRAQQLYTQRYQCGNLAPENKAMEDYQKTAIFRLSELLSERARKRASDSNEPAGQAQQTGDPEDDHPEPAVYSFFFLWVSQSYYHCATRVSRSNPSARKTFAGAATSLFQRQVVDSDGGRVSCAFRSLERELERWKFRSVAESFRGMNRRGIGHVCRAIPYELSEKYGPVDG